MNGNNTVQKLQESLLSVNDADFAKNMVQTGIQTALDDEFDRFIGAADYERTENRKGYRNGSYERQFATRVGSITLTVCRDRAGEFQPELFERYQRSEKAFFFGVTQMFFNGVSTRKVTKVLEQLCGVSISKSTVSKLVVEFDAQIKSWRERRLTKKYRYLIFDARYEKVRENGAVVSKGFVVVIGITEEGIREIIGCYVINGETSEAWDFCIQDLKARGLEGIIFALSDYNAGLRAALGKHFPGIPLQRCQVHFMRNFLDMISKSDAAEAKRLLQDVFAAGTQEEAVRRLETVKGFLKTKKKDKVIEWIEDSIDETLAVYQLPVEHRKKMRSTNMLERFNQELKRRSRVIRIFPNAESCLRLLSALCQETSEEWDNRKYIDMSVGR